MGDGDIAVANATVVIECPPSTPLENTVQIEGGSHQNLPMLSSKTELVDSSGRHTDISKPPFASSTSSARHRNDISLNWRVLRVVLSVICLSLMAAILASDRSIWEGPTTCGPFRCASGGSPTSLCRTRDRRVVAIQAFAGSSMGILVLLCTLHGLGLVSPVGCTKFLIHVRPFLMLFHIISCTLAAAVWVSILFLMSKKGCGIRLNEDHIEGFGFSVSVAIVVIEVLHVFIDASVIWKDNPLQPLRASLAPSIPRKFEGELSSNSPWSPQSTKPLNGTHEFSEVGTSCASSTIHTARRGSEVGRE